MKFQATDFKDVFVIKKTPFEDKRGKFMRTFCAKEFKEYGLPTNLVQTNLSISYEKHTLRGMHYQTENSSEDKLVQCIKGSICDVIIDIRKNSKTFGKYFKIELSEQNDKMLLVPRGFAHGFLSLTDNAYVMYQVSNFYDPTKEKGIRYNDPFFNIQWNCDEPIVSDKDMSWEDFKE